MEVEQLTTMAEASLLKSVNSQSPSISQFFTLITGAQGLSEGEWLEVRVRDVEQKKVVLQEFLTQHEIPPTFKLAPGLDVYYGPGIRTKREGVKSAVGFLNVLWVDFDPYKKSVPFKELSQLIAPPTAIVNSGNGYHLYWALDTPLGTQSPESIADAERTMIFMADALASDHTQDIGHLLRIPGTHNNKQVTPSEVKLVEIHPERKYDIYLLQEVFRLPLYMHAIAVNDIVPEKNEGDRSDRDYKFMTDSIRYGVDEKVLKWIFWNLPIGTAARERPDPEQYFKRTYDAALVFATRSSSAHPFTDFGMAERISTLFGHSIRYLYGDDWYLWSGKVWTQDRMQAVKNMVVTTARRLHDEAPSVFSDPKALSRAQNYARRCESHHKVVAIADLAKLQGDTTVLPENVNADPWLLNCLNGTLDLRNLSLRPHEPKDLITHVIPLEYDPHAKFQMWDDFIGSVTDANISLQGFLQRAVGYSITGDTHEEVLFFVHGPTGTGKSTFLDAIRGTFGEGYITTASFESFLIQRLQGGPRDDLARLARARMVISIEVSEGRALAEDLIKMLTGGDTMVARHLYGRAFEFRPCFKLWLAANDAPKVRHGDDAIWRRILRLPFVHRFIAPDGKKDSSIKETLRSSSEARTAILAWAVQGTQDWLAQGLQAPLVVTEATAEYRKNTDTIGQFLKECTIIAVDEKIRVQDLYAGYKEWAQASTEFVLPRKQFTERLRNREDITLKEVNTLWVLDRKLVTFQIIGEGD